MHNYKMDRRRYRPEGFSLRSALWRIHRVERVPWGVRRRVDEGSNGLMNKNQNIAVNEILKAVKKSDKGWASYKIQNPVTRKVEETQSYVEKFDDIIIGCGIYVK